MVHLAELHIHGSGVQRDYFQAMKLCVDAAREYVPAQYCVGYLYQHGLGMSPDPQNAVIWYRKAGEQGHVGAMLELGKMYSGGADRAEAYLWFARAYIAGQKDAQGLAKQVFKELSSEDTKRLQKRTKQLHIDIKKLEQLVQEGMPERH